MYKSFFKRFLDFSAALIGFLFMSPIFVFVTIGLFLANQGRPFFIQKRPGLHGRIFKIVKFKTMNDKKNAEGTLLPDVQRLTAVGIFVRKTSLDELPQLLNVIKGDMSIVGPRPLLPEYLALYTAEQAKRHEVKPGITGWAQVNGRNAISWEEKFTLDGWYVANQSFAVDLNILMKTVSKVLKNEGVSPKDTVIMPRFDDYLLKNKNQ
jgi:lipopolysaccharide/colanic/teichoic acid biosynthesis glycosyltransferase